MSNLMLRDPDGIEPDALTTGTAVRLYSARVAAEKASAVYTTAIKRCERQKSSGHER